MIAAAILVGFFTAIGWWGGSKTTQAIDAAISTNVIQCQEVTNADTKPANE
ncbi:MAG: hypothetical protein ACO3EL_03380 [Burkholderiaceae bacterium]